MSAFRVILLPGIVLPARLAYEALINALDPDIQAVAKDLEVYAKREPTEDYSLDAEIAGVLGVSRVRVAVTLPRTRRRLEKEFRAITGGRS